MTTLDREDPEALDGPLSAYRASTAAARHRRSRANLSAALVAADVLMVLLVALHVHGTLRAVAGLTFCVVVPGWAIVGLLRLDDVALEAGLTMAAGLSSLVVVAQLAMTLNAWHLTFLQLLVCLLCLPSLLWQALARRWPPASP